MNRSFVVSAVLLMMAACSPQQPNGQTAGEESASEAMSPSAPPKVTDVACAIADRQPPEPFDSLPTIAQEPDGWVLKAAEGVARCGPVEAGRVTCQANAGSVFFALQDYWWYDVPAGRTATISIGEFGSPSCFLNEAG